MSVIADVLAQLVEWAAEKGVLLFSGWVKKEEAEIEIEKQAKADESQLSAATTVDQKAAAADKLRSDTFN